MSRTLIKEIYQKYAQLRSVSPGHDLLKYFSQTNEGFRMNTDTEVSVEFIERFRNGAPTLEELKKQQKKISFSEYQQRLVSAVFGNYMGALEQAVREAVSLN